MNSVRDFDTLVEIARERQAEAQRELRRVEEARGHGSVSGRLVACLFCGLPLALLLIRVW